MSKLQGFLVVAAVVAIAILILVVATRSDSSLTADAPEALPGGEELLDTGVGRTPEKAVGLEPTAPAALAEEDAEALPDPVDLEKADRERDLHGIVVRKDGSPVPGALLASVFQPWRYGRLLTDGQHNVAQVKAKTRSARDGTFSMRLKRGDHVYLHVTAQGLVSTELTMMRAGERVRVVLEEPVKLTVNAKTPAGEPAQGLKLRLFRGGPATVWFEYMGETDAGGSYTFADLPPGESIYLAPRPQRDGWGDPSWILLELPASGAMTHDLTLLAGRTLRGTVTDKTTGKPIPGARVGMSWALVPKTETDAQGHFVLHDWTGSGVSDVHVLAAGYAREQVEVEKKEVLDFALSPGLRVRGRVVDGNGRGLKSAQVTVVGDERSPARLSIGHAWTDEDGRFALDGLSPLLPHVLMVNKHGYAQGLGDIPSPGDRGEVELGEVVIVLEPAIVTKGVLLDPQGKPLAWAQLQIRVAGEQTTWLFTDGDGTFSVTTKMGAVLDIEFAGNVGPSKSQRYRTEQKPIVGKLEGARAGADDVVIRSTALQLDGSVIVRVLDPKGNPIEGLAVNVYPVTVRRASPRTDADGRVKIEKLLVKELNYSVGFSATARQPWFVPTTKPFVPEGQEIVLRLRTGTRIEGTLLTAEGAPTPGHISVLRGKKSVGNAQADKDGHFVAVVDPGQPGPYRLQSTVHQQGAKPVTALVDDVQPGDTGIELRFQAPK